MCQSFGLVWFGLVWFGLGVGVFDSVWLEYRTSSPISNLPTASNSLMKPPERRSHSLTTPQRLKQKRNETTETQRDTSPQSERQIKATLNLSDGRGKRVTQ